MEGSGRNNKLSYVRSSARYRPNSNKPKQINPKQLQEVESSELLNRFPFKKYAYTEEQIFDAMEKLKSYDQQLIRFPYTIVNLSNESGKSNIPLVFSGLLGELKPGQYILPHSSTSYEDWRLWLSDALGAEKFRLETIVKGQEFTQYDIWEKYNREVCLFALEKYSELTPYTVREALFWFVPEGGRRVYEATQFRPPVYIALLKMVYKTLGARLRVLDFCNGWGDRLLGGISCDDIIEHYVGVDPHTSMQDIYKNMVDKFIPVEDAQKYTLICEPFETAKMPNLTYNFIGTSPPYYNIETYCKEPTQSIYGNKTLSEWLDNFMYPSLKKAMDLLEVGGYLILYMNDTYNYETKKSVRYMECIIEYMKETIHNAKYLGVIASAELKERESSGVNTKFVVASPQPIWFWTKISE